MSASNRSSEVGSRSPSIERDDEVLSIHGGGHDGDTDRSPSPILPDDPAVKSPTLGNRKRKQEEAEEERIRKQRKREKNFEMSELAGKGLRNLVADGLSGPAAKEIRDRYVPAFPDKSFSLSAPSMDNSVYQRLKAIKKSSASKGTIDSVEKTLFNLQQMALDVARPILSLEGDTDMSAHSVSAITDFFSLWGNLIGEFTKLRRQNILRQTHPTYRYLLDDKANFSRRELGDLFGRKFIRSMVQAASDEKKLGEIPSTGGGSERRPSGSFYKSNHSDGRDLGTRGGHSSANFDRSSKEPQAGSSARDSRSNYNNRGGYVIPSTPPSPIPFGGRLKYFYRAWERLTNDPWILGVVTVGLRIDLASPPAKWALRPMVFTDAQLELCDTEVSGLLAKEAISLAPSNDVCLQLICHPYGLWGLPAGN